MRQRPWSIQAHAGAGDYRRQAGGRRLDATNARIADLEVRATAALEMDGKISLAKPHR